MDPNQIAVSVLVLVLVAATVTGLTFARGRVRQLGRYAIYLSGATALLIWFRFGAFHEVFVDSPNAVHAGDLKASREKIRRPEPFHFHEFFHYYLGSKYFPELGYLGLYDCTTLADRESADADGVPPRISGYVRDLNDVLDDKPLDQALADCRDHIRPRFSDTRWASFKADLAELRRIAPDDWWPGVIFDAGFNPPPSWSLWGSAVSNLIPIRAGEVPTRLLATALDMVLLVICYLALRRAFGRTTPALATVFFGASAIASYTWNGGAFLRFTWLTSLVLGLCFLKRGRYFISGLFFGASICDRIFPAGFALGALAPLAYQGLQSPLHRQALKRTVAGIATAGGGLVLLSTIVFGFDSWATFFSRIVRHGDIYYVGHIGLKKVLTFRSWVPNQDFWWHAGLRRFHAWNVHLRDTWHQMWLLAVPLQLFGFAAAIASAARRRPEEGALLCGVAFMFLFNLPANYYYVVLALVPAFLLRRAVSAPTESAQLKEYGLLLAFLLFWTFTLVASQIWGDAIVANFAVCTAFLCFLAAWIGVWMKPQWLWSVIQERLKAPDPAPTAPLGGETAAKP